MLILGHRGYSGKYPENTMIAFRKAMEAGADGIELDVHQTKDGQLVIIHDETVNRTTDGSGAVVDLTLSEIKRLNANKRFPEYGPQGVPSLEEYCEWAAANGVFTNIEIKTDKIAYPGIEEKIWDMVVKYGLEQKVIFSSFNHGTLRRMREFLPTSVPVGALVGGDSESRVFPGAFCEDAGFQAYHPHIAMLNDDNVADCHKHGIAANVWSADDAAAIKKLCDWGCNAAITDWPQEAVAWREAAKGE